MFLGGCHKMTPRRVGNRVTLTTSDQCFVQVCGVKQSWSALCEDTRILVQVISSAIRALLPLHVSCWAAKPPKPTSPGLPKSPACWSSTVASRKKRSRQQPLQLLLAQQMEGKGSTVGLAAFLAWICSGEKQE